MQVLGRPLEIAGVPFWSDAALLSAQGIPSLLFSPSGSGAHAAEEWVAVVRPGKVLFEMEGVTEQEARQAMRLASAKLPIKTKFAMRFAEEAVS